MLISSISNRHYQNRQHLRQNSNNSFGTSVQTTIIRDFFPGDIGEVTRDLKHSRWVLASNKSSPIIIYRRAGKPKLGESMPMILECFPPANDMLERFRIIKGQLTFQIFPNLLGNSGEEIELQDTWKYLKRHKRALNTFSPLNDAEIPPNLRPLQAILKEGRLIDDLKKLLNKKWKLESEDDLIKVYKCLDGSDTKIEWFPSENGITELLCMTREGNTQERKIIWKFSPDYFDNEDKRLKLDKTYTSWKKRMGLMPRN